MHLMPASWLVGSGDVLVDVKAGNGVLKPLTSRDPSRVGPYELLGELGAGGFGRVFLGESADGQPAAVKVIHPHLAGDHEFRVRFRREVAAARRVSGRFTARLIDADVDGPEPWLATEYIDGPSLKQRVAQDGPMAADSVLDLVADLAQALAAIHAAGLVHRDLNPQNVLLAEDGPRVIDFGIARAAGASRLTATGNVIGTLAFMSPEQALGHTAGPPSDVFSLGSVLVFAATGQGPFGTGSGPELLYRVAHTRPDLNRVPAELRSLAARCLARDPARRPAPGELVAYLGDARPAPSSSPRQSIPARPGKARPSSSTAKPRSRPWPLLAGLGIILTAGIVAGVILTGQPPIQLAAGTMLWSANTGPYIAAPAVANGAVYVGGANGKVSELTEIDRSTGKRLWTHAVSGGPIDAAPTVKDGIVYASDNSSVYAFDANDGRLRWVSSPGGTLDGTPTFADGAVFVRSFENTVYAINATDGSIRWKYAAGVALITTGSLTQPGVTVC
jgi:eukaryotic-like serine/threonine-protein kinase